MPGVPTIVGYNEWYCPECRFTERTQRVLPNRWHVCPKLNGVSVQLVRAGVKARLIVTERQDYVGNERVQLLGANQRPIMSIVTVRDDGQDAIVFAPTATARAH